MKPSEIVVKYINQLPEVSILLKNQVIRLNKELNKNFISKEQARKELKKKLTIHLVKEYDLYGEGVVKVHKIIDKVLE